MSQRVKRILPVGAELVQSEGTHFRVWAPRRRMVEVVTAQVGSCPLEAESDGYFSGFLAGAGPGTLYQLRLDKARELYPDPASRFQPEGPHGPSEVLDPNFAWTDAGWQGRPLRGQVIYEMHCGSFTSEGSWQAAAAELDALAEMGITVLELMPIADFPGRFGWGYDGVALFAPSRLYGRPEDCKRFIDRAHALGLAVIFDVVYNHLGPDGNYLRQFSEAYFTKRYTNEWGEAINFDGPDAAPVRAFFLANALYWITEYHGDGFRFDATQQIFDASPRPILGEIADTVRRAVPQRDLILLAENEPQEVRCLRSTADGGFGLDGLWNDDFHHCAKVALSGNHEGYYSDYTGSAAEFVALAKHGFLFQGQYNQWQGKRRGSFTRGIAKSALINYLQNHDQVANSPHGRRLHTETSPGRYRAMTAQLLLAPGTPMLFQGQEYGASQAFLYFADHQPELAALVAKGRREFLAQFPRLSLPEVVAVLPEPHAPATFTACLLDASERHEKRPLYLLHCELLKLRRTDPILSADSPAEVDGAVLAPNAWLLRYSAPAGERLLIVNLGRAFCFSPSPEPLLAPPAGYVWAIAWSSEDLRYGGEGTCPLERKNGWFFPAECAVFLAPRLEGDEPSARPRAANQPRELG